MILDELDINAYEQLESEKLDKVNNPIEVNLTKTDIEQILFSHLRKLLPNITKLKLTSINRKSVNIEIFEENTRTFSFKTFLSKRKFDKWNL